MSDHSSPLEHHPAAAGSAACRLDENTRRLLQQLGDGSYHSASELVATTALSRQTIRKRLSGLVALGLTVEIEPGRGYRVAGGLELLEESTIAASFGAWANRIGDLQVLDQVDSTNAEVRRRAVAGKEPPIICVAEHQSRGRGRRGRQWSSSFGGGIWLSILIRLALAPQRLGKVSLVVGLAVAELLDQVGVAGLKLKWPNDILVDRLKLGGILVEYETERGRQGALTIGIGINTAPPPTADVGNVYGATALTTVLGSRRMPSRSVLAGRIAAATLDGLQRYMLQGWDYFADSWTRYDAVSGQRVQVLLPNGEQLMGRAVGITADGALRIEAGGREVSCVAGEVSLRLSG